jgi:hypothetical protein
MLCGVIISADGIKNYDLPEAGRAQKALSLYIDNTIIILNST